MKHPALTRVFAVVLALLCLVMLLAGIAGLRDALDERLRARQDRQRMLDRMEEYRLVDQALAGDISYKEANEALEARRELHDEEASQHRTDLATYTATKGGVSQGVSALDQADAAFAKGKAEYEKGLAEFEKQAAAFEEGYEQYLQGREELEQGREQLENASQALETIQSQLENVRYIGDVLADESLEDGQAAKTALLSAYDGALASLGQAANLGGLLVSQGVISQEQLDAALSAVDTEQVRQGLEQQRAAVAEMDPEALAENEVFGSLRQAYRENRDLAQSAVDAVASGVDEGFRQLEESRAQLEAAQAELDALAETMEQGRQGIEEGRRALEEAGKQIDSGGDALYRARAELWYQLGKLADQEKELRREKEDLDRESRDLTALDEEVRQRRELERREVSLRLMLMDRDGVRERVESGADLLPAAEAYADRYALDIQRMFQGRMAAYILMILGALAGFAGIPAAFEKSRSRLLLLGPVLLCLLCAAAAEPLLRGLGLRISYAALGVLIFAALQLLITAPKAKTPG